MVRNHIEKGLLVIDIEEPFRLKLSQVMMRSSMLWILVAGLLAACTIESPQPALLQVDGNGNSQINQNNLQQQLTILPVESLSEDEANGLLWMREEERLARDIYIAMYDLWGRRVFDNISASEQTHTDAVLELLDRYELEDPSAELPVGVFYFMDLQDLYAELLDAGDDDVIAALKVGALVEEVDIVDLGKQLVLVDHQDITLVYTNLEKASENHLRAFVKNLQQLGVTYTPQVLDQATFDGIVK